MRIFVVLMAMLAASAANAQDALQRVKSSQQLVVGVKDDYPPWSFRDSSGQIVGIEPDLAADLAKRLGVTLRLVPVRSDHKDDRFSKLDSGQVDIVMATMCDMPARRQKAGLIQPYYHASSANVMSLKTAGLRTWDSIRGKTVCMISGSHYNVTPITRFGPIPKYFELEDDALDALQRGDCEAFLYQDAFLTANVLRDREKWKDYEIPLPDLEEEYWSFAVSRDELNAPFGRAVSDIVKDWHRYGLFSSLTEKWGGKRTPFYARMTREFAK